ncbi:MMPL family transporter [Thalassoglobus sp.]|uniref:MMPL family transporter n=1 Tax=Thalassoglobus sp. TaxID=2795869 RepID=UPI003AA7E41A
MYRRIGEYVSYAPIFTIGAWLIVAFSAILTAPATLDVWQDGEFAFLPESSPSRRAQQLFRDAFPPTDGTRFDSNTDVGTSVQRDPLGSNIVVVLFRENRPEGLSNADRYFLSERLVPRLESIRESTPFGDAVDSAQTETKIPEPQRVVRKITTPNDNRIGFFLKSLDNRAELVVLELKTEFLDRQNGLVVDRVEKLLTSSELMRSKPVGLAIAVSGSATVGRDLLRAERESAERTKMATRFLIVVLLLVLYRAPLLAMVPIITVGLAVEFSMALLTHLADLGWIGLFNGLEVYVTVVVYGAGVDYCLFLIARYKEELIEGQSYPDAIVRSIRKIGAALATSAGTSIIGIGMMTFAEFGKFRQAGIAIAIGLLVAVCFAVTFAPALLLLLRHWAFWPDIRKERPQQEDVWLPSTNVWKKIREQRWLDEFWNFAAGFLRKFPGRIFLVTIFVMLPFAIYGFSKQGDLSYGLITDLPDDVTSVDGARAIQAHFPTGITGPVVVLVQFNLEDLERQFQGDNLSDVRTAERLSQQMTDHLNTAIGELDQANFHIADVRNQTDPLGKGLRAKEYLDSLSSSFSETNARRTFSHRTYTSVRGQHAGQVMRLDFVLSTDPFERISLQKLSEIEELVRASIPEPLRSSAEVLSLGPTSLIRDLKSSTDRDRMLIHLLVAISVYLMLVALLRQPAVCAYLIATVVFSYFVSLGVTFLFFSLQSSSDVTEIDWKVPIYLFTFLIAMGEDYNILLMSRVAEDQKRRAPVDGILSALTRTGSIISSCGLIMAGTFATMMFGSLLGMVQLGFALAFGILLDTFVIRPILVPAWLILVNRGQFGPLGKWLGARQIEDSTNQNQQPEAPHEATGSL